MSDSSLSGSAARTDDASQFICFIHGAQAGRRCAKCPRGTTMTGTAGCLVDVYLSSRAFAIGYIESALKAFGDHADRRAFGELDRAAPYLLSLKKTLLNRSHLESPNV